MPYCSKCGFIVKEEDKFCHKCGNALKISMRCVSCGSNLKNGDRFCGKCGHPVDAAASAGSSVITSSNETSQSNNTGNNSNAHKLTNMCLSCGVVLADNVINCNKCGYHVESVKCPVCGNATNPFEVKCNNCNSNIADLVKTDLDKSTAVLRVLLESDSFGGVNGIKPSDQVFRLARQNSIAGLAIVYAFETVAKREGSYAELAQFVYDEGSPDEWDNPKFPEIYNPHDKYASKQEYIESLREKSKRPDFGFFCWAITYARSGKDIYAYRLCLLLSNLYTTLGDIFDNHNFIITTVGVEFQQQAYGLLCVAQKNPELDYSQDEFARKLFANIRYKVARQYFYIEFMGLNESDSSNFKYYSSYSEGFKRAFNMLQNPLREDRAQTKLLSGLMYYNFGNDQKFFEAWKAICNDADYLSSKKDVADEGVFSRSAICMSSIARQNGNINAAMDILKFSYSHLTRKIWCDELQEEYSKYQQDNYGNIVYVG
jgi:hypothetical protein